MRGDRDDIPFIPFPPFISLISLGDIILHSVGDSVSSLVPSLDSADSSLVNGPSPIGILEGTLWSAECK